MPVTQSAHSTLDDDREVKQVVSVVAKAKVFEVKKGRSHSKFKKISPQSLAQVKYGRDCIVDTEKKQQVIKFKYAIGEVICDSEASDIESDSTSDIETEIISF